MDIVSALLPDYFLVLLLGGRLWLSLFPCLSWLHLGLWSLFCPFRSPLAFEPIQSLTKPFIYMYLIDNVLHIGTPSNPFSLSPRSLVMIYPFSLWQGSWVLTTWPHINTPGRNSRTTERSRASRQLKGHGSVFSSLEHSTPIDVRAHDIMFLVRPVRDAITVCSGL